MSNTAFMDRIRSFLGLRQEPPRNDFRNPIWGSDDDDDGDDLYSRNDMDAFNPVELHKKFVNDVQDMFKTFGSLFGDMKDFIGHIDMGTVTEFPADQEPDNFNSNSIRDYYLKPDYHERKYEHQKGDIGLDDSMFTDDISDLLLKEDEHLAPQGPFDGSLVPGHSYCKTIITTCIRKSDGTIETRRIVKNGNEVTEETITTEPDTRNPNNPALNPIATTNIKLSQLPSLLKLFY